MGKETKDSVGTVVETFVETFASDAKTSVGTFAAGAKTSVGTFAAGAVENGSLLIWV